MQSVSLKRISIIVGAIISAIIPVLLFLPIFIEYSMAPISGDRLTGQYPAFDVLAMIVTIGAIIANGWIISRVVRDLKSYWYLSLVSLASTSFVTFYSLLLFH